MGTDPKNLVGVTLSGRYLIERPIGEGGMGAVFEATQLSLGRRVAIKVVKPQAGSDDDAMKRFERETEAIAKLAHPNIVQVVDAGRSDDGTMYLAMELLAGDNVRTLLRGHRTIPVPRALAIVEDVASALAAAHAAGVIHRDLKAENVMLVRAAGKSEIAKVLDFGVAKITTSTQAPPVTGSGFVAGTPGCIAPEQMLEKRDDPRSDLYSVGVLLFEMLAGEGPFTSTSTMELMLKHLTEQPPRVADIARARGKDDVPAAVDELVATLLAKDPDGRPASAAALVDIVASLRDATRATQPDVRVPSWPTSDPVGTAIGSRVVATPPSSAPSSPFSSAPSASAPSSASSAALAGTGTAPSSPSSSAPSSSSPAAQIEAGTASSLTGAGTASSTALGTAPTSAVPVPVVPAKPPLWRAALRMVGLALVVVAAMWGWRAYALYQADRPSTNAAAEADIKRGFDDLWQLDLDKLDDDTAAAIQIDPKAPLAHVLRFTADVIERRPLVSLDADLYLARTAAKQRANMMVQRTRTEALVDVLAQFTWQDVMKAWDVHCANYRCDDFDRFVVANKLARADAPGDVVEAMVDGIRTETPASLYMKGRIARWSDHLAESHATLERALTLAPGRAAIVDALVDTELEEGKADDAVAALGKLALKNDRAALRFAYFSVRRGDAGAFNAPLARLRGLADHSDARIEGLTQAGYELGALGRFKEADALWKEAIADRPRTPYGDARALETAAVAVLFSIVFGDDDLAAEWLKRLNEIGVVSGPGVERLVVFQRAARALLAVFDDNAPIATAEDEFQRLMETPNDVPIVPAVVRWHLALRKHDYGEAAKLAEAMGKPCFRHLHVGITAEARGDVAAAKKALDTGLALENGCTTGDDLIPWVEAILFVNEIAHRANIAMKENDVVTARAMLARFHKLWPSADPLNNDGSRNFSALARLSQIEAWAALQR